jgi:amino acid transporter
MAPSGTKKEAAPNDDVPAIRAAFVVIVTVVVVFSLLALGAWALKAGKVDDSVRLPLLVIAGLVSLIALLAVMAIAFKTVHLANQTQALGLPDGTVRAVIALSLILIFAVVTVYLFSNLSDLDTVACQELEALKNQIAKTTGNRSLAATPVATDTSGTNAPTSTSLSPADTRRQSKLASSEDFAKQLLIMLGTLITSITSFYFASSKTDSASSRTPPPPPPSKPMTLSGVSPPTAPRDNLPTEFTVMGTGLTGVGAVSLQSGTLILQAQDVSLPTDTAVRFKPPANLNADKWEVIIETRDGVKQKVPGSIEITV